MGVVGWVLVGGAGWMVVSVVVGVWVGRVLRIRDAAGRSSVQEACERVH